MSQDPQTFHQIFFPFFSYDDAPAAIDWLEKAFGFQRTLVVPGPDDSVAHAQMSFRGAFIMLGSTKKDDPLERAGSDAASTNRGVYVHVEEVDAHFERAKAAGAEVLMPPTDQEYGGRDYAVRDPEGNLWSFGTYRPGQD